MAGERRLGVLIISACEQTRRAFRLSLEDDDLEVIATLRSPLFALSALAQRWPDVVVLDRDLKIVDVYVEGASIE